MPASCSQANNTLNEPLAVHLQQLPPQWQEAFQSVQTRAALEKLDAFLQQRLAAGACIFPRTPFLALQPILPEQVKVIILGQDPYHGANQAQGLAFSVPDSTPCPPSLRNIFAELKNTYPDARLGKKHNLLSWAKQGVLLLNTVLTVESGQPASHAKKGWETVTDALLHHIAQQSTPKVFLLWGAFAQSKIKLLENYDTPMCLLTANHPSPLSARRPPKPFIGSNHFALCNMWLKKHGLDPIEWVNL